MFFGLQPWHLIVIIGAALLIFGPDRLPTIAKDAGKVLRQLRRMANDVREDLQEELGPEIAGLDLKSMHPKALIHKHLLDPALDDVDEERAEEAAKSTARSTAKSAPLPATVGAQPTVTVGAPEVASLASSSAASAAVAASVTPFDFDAT